MEAGFSQIWSHLHQTFRIYYLKKVHFTHPCLKLPSQLLEFSNFYLRSTHTKPQALITYLPFILKETAPVIASPISTVLKVIMGYPLNYKFGGHNVNGLKGSLDGFVLNELVIKYVQNSLR